MDKIELKKLANKLFFDLTEEEYDELSQKFDNTIKKIELIDKIEGLNEVEPMFYPFDIEAKLREDKVTDEMPIEDILQNASNKKYNQVKVPKVVGE